MFTLDQLKESHSKVKSGADFPAYINDIRGMEVTHYVAFVNDGRIDYYGADHYVVHAPSKYTPIVIADHVANEEFQSELRAHQQGKTDFLTFITMCARTGIEKWEINMEAKSCTYYDKLGNTILVEQIPIEN